MQVSFKVKGYTCDVAKYITQLSVIDGTTSTE